jgi:hypothetical protein
VCRSSQANILCFRPVHARGQELALRDALILEGEFHLSITLFASERWLRIVVMSPNSSAQSIDALLARLRAEPQTRAPAAVMPV